MNKNFKIKNKKNNIFQIAFNTPRGNILTPLLLCVLYFSACFIYNIYNIQLTGIFKPCYFKMLTGYNCPGCGTTRAIQELLNLNIYEAFRYNPVIGSIALILLILIAARFINGIKNFFFSKNTAVYSISYKIKNMADCDNIIYTIYIFIFTCIATF